MEQTKTTTGKKTRYKTKEPSMYNVIFLNDDVTTMDFVVMVLMRIFRKTESVATELMLKVDREGSAIVGTYSCDIAESKANYTTQLARANGFPLKVITEEA